MYFNHIFHTPAPTTSGPRFSFLVSKVERKNNKFRVLDLWGNLISGTRRLWLANHSTDFLSGKVPISPCSAGSRGG